MTTTLPDKVPYILSVDTASDQEWYYWGNTFYHDYVCTDYFHLPSLHESKVGNKVGILITANEQLHLFLNGKNAAELATGLPVHKSLFGVIHVFGRCSKIKSEILSGTLYGVCVCNMCIKPSLGPRPYLICVIIVHTLIGTEAT